MESEDREVGPRMQIYMVDTSVGRQRRHGRGRTRGKGSDGDDILDEVDKPDVKPLGNTDRELVSIFQIIANSRLILPLVAPISFFRLPESIERRLQNP